MEVSRNCSFHCDLKMAAISQATLRIKTPFFVNLPGMS